MPRGRRAIASFVAWGPWLLPYPCLLLLLLKSGGLPAGDFLFATCMHGREMEAISSAGCSDVDEVRDLVVVETSAEVLGSSTQALRGCL